MCRREREGASEDIFEGGRAIRSPQTAEGAVADPCQQGCVTVVSARDLEWAAACEERPTTCGQSPNILRRMCGGTDVLFWWGPSRGETGIFCFCPVGQSGTEVAQNRLAPTGVEDVRGLDVPMDVPGLVHRLGSACDGNHRLEDISHGESFFACPGTQIMAGAILHGKPRTSVGSFSDRVELDHGRVACHSRERGCLTPQCLAHSGIGASTQHFDCDIPRRRLLAIEVHVGGPAASEVADPFVPLQLGVLGHHESLLSARRRWRLRDLRSSDRSDSLRRHRTHAEVPAERSFRSLATSSQAASASSSGICAPEKSAASARRVSATIGGISLAGTFHAGAFSGSVSWKVVANRSAVSVRVKWAGMREPASTARSTVSAHAPRTAAAP